LVAFLDQRLVLLRRRGRFVLAVALRSHHRQPHHENQASAQNSSHGCLHPACRDDKSPDLSDLRPAIYPAYARFSSSMCAFSICTAAPIVRWAFSVSGSLNISSRALGTTCQETPYLFLSQPHICAFLSPPSASFSQ